MNGLDRVAPGGADQVFRTEGLGHRQPLRGQVNGGDPGARLACEHHCAHPDRAEASVEIGKLGVADASGIDARVIESFDQCLRR